MSHLWRWHSSRHQHVSYLGIFTISFSVTLDSPEWKEYVSQHSLPYVLKMLNGLCQNHSKTQVTREKMQLRNEPVCDRLFLLPLFLCVSLQLMVCDIIPQVHLLEQVSTSEHIGTLAENLLETMRENPVCEAAVRIGLFHVSILRHLKPVL